MNECPECGVELIVTPYDFEGKIVLECPACEDEFTN